MMTTMALATMTAIDQPTAGRRMLHEVEQEIYPQAVGLPVLSLYVPLYLFLVSLYLSLYVSLDCPYMFLVSLYLSLYVSLDCPYMCLDNCSYTCFCMVPVIKSLPRTNEITPGTGRVYAHE